MSHHGSGLPLTHPLDTHSKDDDKTGALLVIRQTLVAYILESLVRWKKQNNKTLGQLILIAELIGVAV